MLNRGIATLAAGAGFLTLGLALYPKGFWQIALVVSAVALIGTGVFRIVASFWTRPAKTREQDSVVDTRNPDDGGNARFNRIVAATKQASESSTSTVSWPSAPETAAAPILEAPFSAPVAFETRVAEFARPGLALFRPYPPLDMPDVRSHVGGLPSLPADMAWPRAIDDSGCIAAHAPLHFLAQVDLAEQPWLPEGFPNSGTLLFFGALPDSYFWGTSNDARVLYDGSSQGVPTAPPDDLGEIDGGYGDYSGMFGNADWLRCRTFPQWPLLGCKIDTMPDGDAFVANSYHDPEFAEYHAALIEFRAATVANATGIDLDEIAQWHEPVARSMLDEPGFPWVTRYVSLWCQRVSRDCPDALQPIVAAWPIGRATARPTTRSPTTRRPNFAKCSPTGRTRGTRCLPNF